ncbi:MAG: sigma-70 family RNA polymerase sigma factor [Clostridia bacterium]|nr:sigma-70 family RNA polymerase sigma factor [Clostridia bacterium]
MELEKLFENAECEKAIVHIAEGEHEALGVIHRHMNRQIYAVAYAVLRDFSLSDDVVQETYVKILEKAFTYRRGTNARAWVLSIARNIAIDLFRHRKFEYHTDEVQEHGVRFDEGSVLASMEVKKALDTLDDEERQIITLKIYAGLKHREIAALLGITMESSKKKYQRAVAKLRELI